MELLPLATACHGGREPDIGPADTDTDSETPWSRPEGGELVLTMFDGVTVPTTYLPASRPGRPVVVLMAVDSLRLEWPQRMRDELVARDWTVVEPAMRGYNGSGGRWEDGGNLVGIQDIHAYVSLALEDGYGPVALVAGNGHDGAALRYGLEIQRGRFDEPPPAAWVWFTSNRHAETLGSIDDLDRRPSLFQYTWNQDDWAERQKLKAVPEWQFRGYDASGSDLQIFDAQPDAPIDDMVAFFETVWPE
jgi:hypothetical protein